MQARFGDGFADRLAKLNTAAEQDERQDGPDKNESGAWVHRGLLVRGVAAAGCWLKFCRRFISGRN
jgi:hypothetical protein